MFENLVNRMKVVNDSVRADVTNRMEKSSIQQRVDEVDKELKNAYARLGEETYRYYGEARPAELSEAFQNVDALLAQRQEFAAQAEESDRILNDKKRELDARRQEIADQEQAARDQREFQRMQRMTAAPSAEPNSNVEQVITGAFCPNCGNPLDAQAKFCPACGNKVDDMIADALANAGEVLSRPEAVEPGTDSAADQEGAPDEGASAPITEEAPTVQETANTAAETMADATTAAVETEAGAAEADTAASEPEA